VADMGHAAGFVEGERFVFNELDDIGAVGHRHSRCGLVQRFGVHGKVRRGPRVNGRTGGRSRNWACGRLRTRCCGNGGCDEHEQETSQIRTHTGICHRAPGRMGCEHNGKPSGEEAQADAERGTGPTLRLAHPPFFPWAILFPELTMDNQSGTAINRFCAGCGAPLLANAGFCASCGQRVEPLGTQAVATAPMPPAPQPPQSLPAQPANVAGVSQQGLKCPRCGSTQVQAAKRGWKWTTGFVGSGKMIATCLQCGNKF